MQVKLQWKRLVVHPEEEQLVRQANTRPSPSSVCVCVCCVCVSDINDIELTLYAALSSSEFCRCRLGTLRLGAACGAAGGGV